MVFATEPYYHYEYDDAGNRTKRVYHPLEIQKKSIEVKKFEAVVKISPNPAKDYFDVEIPEIGNYQETKIQLYDINGKLLKEKKNVQSVTKFHFKSTASNGIYFISIDLDGAVKRFKVIRIK